MSEVKVVFTGYIEIDSDDPIADAIEQTRLEYGNDFADYAEFTLVRDDNNVEWIKSETIKVRTKTCCVCNKADVLTLDRQAVESWQAGEYVHKAFPDMPADERELLISGTHPACWNTLFPGDDSDE